MSSIPGLLHIPVEESSSSADDIKLTTFDMKTFTVPGSHRYGKCRPISDFSRLDVLGEGTYGTVYKAKENKTDEIFALKKLKIGKESELMPLSFIREITNLKLLKHDNIVNLLGIAVGKNFESTYLILEYCEYALWKLIDDFSQEKAHVVLDQTRIKNIMFQLFTGLDYIHKQCVLHRDLSPSNILFSGSGILKICDFGLSRKISYGNITPNVGLRWYRAPEILFGSESYNSAVDIWSCGCILAELIRRKPLFCGDSDAEQIKLIIDFLGTPTESLWPGYSKLPIPSKYELRLQPYNRIRSCFEMESGSTIMLLQKVLVYNPKIRFSARQCLEHPYFSDLPLACSTEELLHTLKTSVAIAAL